MQNSLLKRKHDVISATFCRKNRDLLGGNVGIFMEFG